MPGTPEETPGTRAQRAWQRLWAVVVRSLALLELALDRVLWGLRRRFGRLGPLKVLTFRGFGTTASARLRGRVLEASMLERSLPADTTLRNLRRMLRRFNSREVPDVTVRARVGQAEISGVTDDEGYFELCVPGLELADAGVWKTVEVELVQAKVPGFAPARATAEILVPSSTAELGVISDIDDTVLQTHVTQRLRMIWLTLSGSAYTRTPFDGTSELYRALTVGASGRNANPLFYVSKSPWNLYDFLVDFMDYHQLPRGPLLLRDIGLHAQPPVDHKSEAVARLLALYPSLPFILIGDSGERDPEIYVEAAARHAGRIAAIYIRDLGLKRHRKRALDAAQLSERARAYGTEMLWVDHARVALEHARERGWARRT